MASGPFMFCDNTGAFFEVSMGLLGTVHTLSTLAKICRANGDAAHTAAACALDTTLQTGLVAHLTFAMKAADVAKPDAELVRKAQGGNPACWGYEQSLVVVVPGKHKNAYNPDHRLKYLGVGPHPKTWAWSAAHVLAPHVPLLRKLARGNDMTFGDTLIKKVTAWQSDLDADRLLARVPSLESEMGRCQAYVVFSDDRKKYIDRSGYPSANLSSAAIYESAAAAEKWIKKNADRDRRFNQPHENNVVVPVAMCVGDVPAEKMSPDGLAVFEQALVEVRKEEMERALQACTLEQLERRLAELGHQVGGPIKPKKM